MHRSLRHTQPPTTTRAPTPPRPIQAFGCLRPDQLCSCKPRAWVFLIFFLSHPQLSDPSQHWSASGTVPVPVPVPVPVVDAHTLAKADRALSHGPTQTHSTSPALHGSQGPASGRILKYMHPATEPSFLSLGRPSRQRKRGPGASVLPT